MDIDKNSEAFEMWTYRRMLRISWKKHKSIEEVIQLANTTIKKGKLKYFDHIVRA